MGRDVGNPNVFLNAFHNKVAGFGSSKGGDYRIQRNFNNKETGTGRKNKYVDENVSLSVLFIVSMKKE